MDTYDVLIMGAGRAGGLMALHLSQQAPELSIALVDPLPQDRSGITNRKVGEALIEWSSSFLCQLGLRDHLEEEQTWKAGLNWHYQKRAGTVRSMDDYYSHFTLPAALSTWFIDIPKFETAVLERVAKAGVDYREALVVDVALASGDGDHAVTIKHDGRTSVVRCRHLVDASARQQIICKKLGLTQAPIEGIDTSSVWVRLEDFDRSLLDEMQLFQFREDGSLHPNYFSTNHFMAAGHWIWIIPLDDDVESLSLGIVSQNGQIPLKDLNSLEKFTGFLAENNALLHRLLRSGKVRDFSSRAGLSRKTRRFFSADRWYVIGEAGIMHDPMGSPGIGTVSSLVEMTTDLIRREAESGWRDAVEATDAFAVKFFGLLEHAFNHHDVLLGSPSANSWNVAQFYNVYFGFLLPVVLGKLHLDREFQLEFVSEIEADLQRALTEMGELMAARMGDGRVVWSTNATNVIVYHDHYCSFDSLYGNEYRPVAKESARRCIELFRASLGLAEGQSRVLSDGLRAAVRHGRQRGYGYHYYLGCVTVLGPIAYGLMCLAPLMGRRFRFRSAVPLPSPWRALLWPYTKLGLPPGLFLCRPEHLRSAQG